ncbi:AAA domain-containing protein [Hydrogenispora ethanolica]|uniref:AAA domain-containing protein n=1 Tax=Hydrogenispora ethanolica TaxID=1082276 RepID=A0A4R1S858_HYDET|nr:AAA family ATPase [Hydrogenispora ethanolica]TCL75314.1 AAA domain-containing protein [Hydrogenispora ethanolica]
MSLVVNFLGGPGTGKSIMAAALYYELQKLGISCGLVPEFPRDLLLEDNMVAIQDQLYVFANQAHRQEILRGKVDVIITDSPLILQAVYNAETTSDTFKALVLERFNSFDNLNFFIKRSNDYDQEERFHSFSEAQRIDSAILKVFKKNRISPFKIIHRNHPIEAIAHMVCDWPQGYRNRPKRKKQA